MVLAPFSFSMDPLRPCASETSSTSPSGASSVAGAAAPLVGRGECGRAAAKRAPGAICHQGGPTLSPGKAGGGKLARFSSCVISLGWNMSN